MKSTSNKYGIIAILIHWISALLIIALIISGFLVASVTDTAHKVFLLKIHIPMGISILVLTFLRLIWWTFADKKPTQQEGTPRAQIIMMKTLHRLFYLIIFMMAMSGIGMVLLSGLGNILFSEPIIALPNFQDDKPHMPHSFGARLLIAFIALHIIAVLYHHFIKKDRTIKRMWFGKPKTH